MSICQPPSTVFSGHFIRRNNLISLRVPSCGNDKGTKDQKVKECYKPTESFLQDNLGNITNAKYNNDIK